ncbi:MAG: hypothetical protein RLN75_04450, partial [Longimicrobiales bacterium]
MNHVPPSRLTRLNDAPVRDDGRYVVYWMVAHRRLEWNFALDQAVGRAREFDVPLVILEALRIGYPWASPRHHRFVLDGMREHRDRLAGGPVTYLPYVEPSEGAGKGLLSALAAKACLVVTDDYPVFFLPRMQATAARRLDVRLERVDSNGLYPMRAAARTFTMAVHFRRHLQKHLGTHLTEMPSPAPLDDIDLADLDTLPDGLLDRWPPADDGLLDGDDAALAAPPLAHDVPPVPISGGASAARERLETFLARHLESYGEGRNDPDDDRSSRLSPWLHWGHLSTHEAFHR